MVNVVLNLQSIEEVKPNDKYLLGGKNPDKPKPFFLCTFQPLYWFCGSDFLWTTASFSSVRGQFVWCQARQFWHGKGKYSYPRVSEFNNESHFYICASSSVSLEVPANRTSSHWKPLNSDNFCLHCFQLVAPVFSLFPLQPHFHRSPFYFWVSAGCSASKWHFPQRLLTAQLSQSAHFPTFPH